MIDVFVASLLFYFCPGVVTVLYNYLSICNVSSFSFRGVGFVLVYSSCGVVTVLFMIDTMQCVLIIVIDYDDVFSVVIFSHWFEFVVTVIIFIVLALLPFCLIINTDIPRV